MEKFKLSRYNLKLLIKSIISNPTYLYCKSSESTLTFLFSKDSVNFEKAPEPISISTLLSTP